MRPATCTIVLPDGRSVEIDRRPPGSPLAVSAASALAVGTRATVAKAEGQSPTPGVEPGLTVAGTEEWFVSGHSAPVFGTLWLTGVHLDKGGVAEARLSDSLLPAVLSPEAVAGGVMPPLGHSALPATLADVVPERLRYWKAADADTARRQRDELFDLGLFTPSLVRRVDGEYRLCVQKLFLYKPEGDPKTTGDFMLPVPDDAEVVTPLTKRDWRETLERAAAEATSFLVLSPTSVEQATEVIAAVKKADPICPWLVAVDEGLPGAVDHLATLGVPLVRYGRQVLATSERVAGAEPLAVTTVEKRMTRLVKADDSAEERYVLGIVLEPETVDSQGDIYSEDEIRRAAHTFMSDYRTLGLQHKSAIGERARLLECYVAPCNLEIGGEAIKKGTWLMGWRVADDDLWQSVRKGDLTGFSIGGEAVRRPERKPTAALSIVPSAP